MTVRFSARALVLVLSCVAAACHSTPSEPNPSMLVSASVSPAAFHAGDAATVTVVVENKGTRTVNLFTCPAWFEVLKGADVVAPGTQACAASWVATSLEPGATYTHAFAWRGDTRSLTNPPTFLAAGRYTLRAAVRVESAVFYGTPVGVELTR